MSQEEAETIVASWMTATSCYRQHLRDKTIQHAFVLLPEAIPSPLRDTSRDSAPRGRPIHCEAEITVDHVATLVVSWTSA